MIKVTAAIIINNKKVLIGRRSNHKDLAGYWEFPGGKVEPNELDEECLVREIEEELGIHVLVESFFMENQHNYGATEILLKSYLCELEPNQDFVLTDHDKIKWVCIKNLSAYNLAPADIPIAKALNERFNI